MHKIHKDTINFAKHYDEAFYNGIENIYEGKPLKVDPEKPYALVVTGTSGSGKDTIVDHIIENFPKIKQVKTATSRARRFEFAPKTSERSSIEFSALLEEIVSSKTDAILDNANLEGIIIREPEYKYVWMREKTVEETQDGYFENLIKEHEFIEHDVHYGNLYGIPKKSVDVLVDAGLVPLFRIDIHGAITVAELLKDELNVVVLTILPDKKDDSMKRLELRSNSKNAAAENIDLRIDAMVEEYAKFNLVTNFYMRNTTVRNNDATGLARGFVSVEEFISRIFGGV